MMVVKIQAKKTFSKFRVTTTQSQKEMDKKKTLDKIMVMNFI